MVRTRLPASLGMGFLLLVVLGCGPTLHQPSGKITKDGSPLKWTDKDYPIVALYAESDKDFGSPQTVALEKDGNFKVKGQTGAGVPAGKYKFSIVIHENGPSGKDMLGGKYSKANAPLVEVKNSATEIVVDLK